MLLQNTDALVFTEQPRGFFLVYGEKIVETALVSSLIVTLADSDFHFHDIVSPSP